MFTHEQLDQVVGATAYDSDGDKIGKIGNVYYDDETDQPKWMTVSTGFFGTNETFVPAEEEQLYRHYSLSSTGHTGVATGTGTDTEYAARDAGDTEYAARDTATTTTGDSRADLAGDADVVGRDTSGPTTDKAMTRSEEQLRVGTQTVETGRARLRKHIVTENVSTSVPVSHEEVTLEREPITEANRGDALSGADLTEEEHEVTLHAEQAVVQKDVVPVERVRLGTETVSGTEQVDDTVRKEVIESEGAEGHAADR